MILILSPLNARENAEDTLQRAPNLQRCLLERALNHRHPTHDFNRAALREGRALGQSLTFALQEQYPDRGFVIDYLEEQISFYQRGEGAEEGNEPPRQTELRPEEMCEQCQQNRPYTLRTSPDPEFPRADWGDCAVYGAEMLLRTWEIREVIGPAS